MTFLKLIASFLGKKVADCSEQSGQHVSSVIGAYWSKLSSTLTVIQRIRKMGAARVDISTVQRGLDPTDPEDDFEITVEGFEYYTFFIYFLG